MGARGLRLVLLVVWCIAGRDWGLVDCFLGPGAQRARLVFRGLSCWWVVPVGAMGLYWPGIAFPGCGGLVGCVQSRELGACAPRLPRFILLVSFCETLLVVSILYSLLLPFEAALAVLKGLNGKKKN